MPGYHAEDRGTYRTLSCQGPRPLHHGDWKTGFGYESEEGDCGPAADSGACLSLAFLIRLILLCVKSYILMLNSSGVSDCAYSERTSSICDRKERGEVAGAGTENSHQDRYPPL